MLHLLLAAQLSLGLHDALAAFAAHRPAIEARVGKDQAIRPKTAAIFPTSRNWATATRAKPLRAPRARSRWRRSFWHAAGLSTDPWIKPRNWQNSRTAFRPSHACRSAISARRRLRIKTATPAIFTTPCSRRGPDTPVRSRRDPTSCTLPSTPARRKASSTTSLFIKAKFRAQSETTPLRLVISMQRSAATNTAAPRLRATTGTTSSSTERTMAAGKRPSMEPVRPYNIGTPIRNPNSTNCRVNRSNGSIRLQRTTCSRSRPNGRRRSLPIITPTPKRSTRLPRALSATAGPYRRAPIKSSERICCAANSQSGRA